jgi:dimethylargininase
MVRGLTTAGLGLPDYALAKTQHREYVAALEQCGCEVRVLPADSRYPDSVFVEDVALLIGEAAVITRPGAVSRRLETVEMRSVLSDYFNHIEEIQPPGTLEAGDVLEVDGHYYIGISDRTNAKGAEQLISILKKYGKSGSTIRLEKYLHLKTGVAYLGNNTLLLAGELKKCPDFHKFHRIEVEEEEEYAANSIMVNDMVLIPYGYPGIHENLKTSGFDVIQVDTSEFRKLDGGLSCLSLRF